MHISRRLQQIKPSATLTINAKAQELRAQGREIISLAVGEPDFPTPEHVCQAAKEAIDQGFTRYTAVPGIPELREAVAQYFQTFYSVKAEKEAVIVSNGGKQCLYNLFQALLNPGDEVLLAAPYWVSYPDMIQLAEGSPVVVPTLPENNFQLIIDDLEEKLTSRSKILILNTPSNPTGCHYTQEDLDQIAKWALERGLFIISDEIYDQLVYPPAAPASLSTWYARYPEQVAVVNGLSKSFAMSGWRLGYTLAHPDLVKQMSKIQGQSSSNVCSIAQKAALAALTGSWEPVQKMRESFARRRDLALSYIEGWSAVTCAVPDGAFYLFPKVSACYTEDFPDSTALCAHLLEEAGVALVPGAAFGEDEYIRFSYAVSDQNLEKALTAIGQVLS